MDFSVEIATDQQAEQICAIWESGWHDAHNGIVPQRLCELRTTKSFIQRTADNLDNTRVAINAGTVLGFSIVKEDELYQMYVSQKARGRGVAQALMSDAENRIRTNGHNRAWLACAVGNQRAARFYEKSGWVNAGPEVVDLDTSTGTFPLEVWRFERSLNQTNVG
ncbi:GNAT family N-acetyltransferase [Cognatiyoonia sp. IB215446]|uniref:GNAT family N-acetyltransferase n=1 Tax=Cognatiyoonia sp. IB215446 TaxID=3097355 RepID=UPI002A178B00|nr:GNAT family N-acetyltransferase [Cognatiyoonia sp. IB215446]MDX8349004.1 GNAT family N-acetyltransferase [Cognatiyoonia sp. IB215446]